MPESSCFRTPFESQPVHVSVTLLKYERQNFCPNFPIIKEKLNQKTSLSVRPEISVLFVNTLTADHMYSGHNLENLSQHVQRPLSQKRKPFSGKFIEFLECSENFAYFQKKDKVHSLNICKVIQFQKCVDVNARKLLFKNTLPGSTHSCVSNTVEICTAGLLFEFPINNRKIELENISFSQN